MLLRLTNWGRLHIFGTVEKERRQIKTGHSECFGSRSPIFKRVKNENQRATALRKSNKFERDSKYHSSSLEALASADFIIAVTATTRRHLGKCLSFDFLTLMWIRIVVFV